MTTSLVFQLTVLKPFISLHMHIFKCFVLTVVVIVCLFFVFPFDGQRGLNFTTMPCSLPGTSLPLNCFSSYVCELEI